MHLRWTNARFCVLCVRTNHFEALMVSSGEKRLQSSQDGNLVKGSLLEKQNKTKQNKTKQNGE